jgi:hypothetical protein
MSIFGKKKRAPMARTLVEAELYLSLNPCTCGGFEPPEASQRPDGLWFDGACPLCGARSTREPFGMALDAPGFGTTWETFYGGPRPSTLVDAGEWLYAAERYADSVAVPKPGEQNPQYIERVTLATAQVTEYLKFIPGTRRLAKPPSSAYWTVRGRTAARNAVVLDRAIQEAYRYGVSEGLMARGGGNYRGTPIRGTFPRPY